MQGRRIRKAAGINKSQGLSWSFRENEKKNSFLQIVHTGFTAHPVFFSMGTGSLSLGQSDQNMKLTIHLPLVPGLGNSAAKLLLSHIPSLRRQGQLYLHPFLTTFILGKTKTLIFIFYRRGKLRCLNPQSKLCVNGSSYCAVNHVRLSHKNSSVLIPSFFGDPYKTNINHCWGNLHGGPYTYYWT